VRFTSPHPKDFPDDLLRVVASTPNVCKQLHMPAQSGSTSTLARMRRGYTREAYLELIARVREMIPGVSISSDFISGFCGETEAEHAETISLLERVRFETAFMFHYSLRDKTHAARHLSDDVPEDVKKRRLAEVIETFRAGAARANEEDVGRTHLVLVEGVARKSDAQMSARSDTGKRVIIEGRRTRDMRTDTGNGGGGDDDDGDVDIKPGDYVVARVERAGPSTLIARPLGITTATRFYETHGAAWY
jgi:tRNA A37 methylthiotransferase MiaB